MSLPFVPPPQRLAVDDVLPVEIITDSDLGFQDARAHLDVEHMVRPDGNVTGLHEVVTVPIAVAIMKAPAVYGEATVDGAFTEVFSRGFSSAPYWRYTFAAGHLEFAIESPWYGIEVFARGTSGQSAFGWRRWRDARDPRKGYVGLRDAPPLSGINALLDLVGVTHVLISVYGDP